MQKEYIIEKLKAKGFRITKQRKLILDIILENQCESCKEIYYKASAIDDRIGSATVYRMINTLEEIGAISRKNLYKVEKEGLYDCQCEIQLDDNSIHYLTSGNWNKVILEGMKVCGYIKDQHIKSIKILE